MLLALVFANLGRALPRTGGPYAYARRAFGDFVGFQTAWGYWIAVWAGNAAIAVAFVGYLTVFWPATGDQRAARRARRDRLIWLLTFDQRARRARVRHGAGRHHRPEVRAAGRDRHHRAVLHRRRQLRAVRPQRPRRQPALDHRGARRCGPSSGSSRRPCRPRRSRIPRRTIPRATILGTGDHDARSTSSPPSRSWASSRPRSSRESTSPFADAAGVDLRRRLGQGHRAGRAGLDLRRAQRLDPAPGPRAARRGRGRAVPGSVRQGPRQAPHAGLRPGRLLRAGQRAAAHELHEGPGRGVRRS